MKVAVCMFGQLRGDDETFRSIQEHVVRPNSADVFAHTWDYRPDCGEYLSVPDEIGELVDWGDRSIEELLPTRRRAVLNSDTLGTFLRTFHPQKLIVEEQALFDPTRYVKSAPQRLHTDGPRSDRGLCNIGLVRSYQRVRSQALSRLRSFEAIEKPEAYDVVILLRNDIVFKSPLQILQLNRPGLYAQSGSGMNYVLDSCFFGDPESVRSFVQMHHTLDEILISNNCGHEAAFNEMHTGTFIRSSEIQAHNFNFTDHLERRYGDRGIKYPIAER